MMSKHIIESNLHSDHFDIGQDGKVTSKQVLPLTAPNMTKTERDALSATNGMIIYNTDDKVFNFFEDGAWKVK